MSGIQAQAQPVSTVEWSPEFDAILRRHLPLNGGPVPPQADLASLGLDSLGTVSLVMELEDTLGIAIPDEVLVPETFRTADALWQVIAHLAGVSR
jgi:acyl carrier protein